MLRERTDAELSACSTLDSISGPGRPVDAAILDNLIRNLVIARQINSSYRRVEGSKKRLIAQSGLGKDFAQIDPSNPPIIGAAKICQPISSQLPAFYGARPN